jgi:hypothetical protein
MDSTAARKANIPSVIISNFTFDSCYSYLSAFNEEASGEQRIETNRLNELVAITVQDYAQAELLLRLPGAIPIPGFDEDIPLPATTWVEDRTGFFTAEIDGKLAEGKDSRMRPRRTIDMPLIVRPLTRSAYDPKTKLALLAALGVPAELLKPDTKILLVSFGGQVIPNPRPPTSTDHGHDLEDLSAPNQTPPHDSLLPPGWIAIICGLPPKPRPHQIPDRFFSTTDSKFNYVPDLTAIADVVLGKLGYGTCSEVIATRTPFISGKTTHFSVFFFYTSSPLLTRVLFFFFFFCFDNISLPTTQHSNTLDQRWNSAEEDVCRRVWIETIDERDLDNQRRDEHQRIRRRSMGVLYHPSRPTETATSPERPSDIFKPSSAAAAS